MGQGTLAPKTAGNRKTLDSNDQNQVADQQFSLKQWFAGGAQSSGLRKPGKKGKGKVTLFNVGSSFSYEAGINGSRRCVLYPPPSVSAPFYGYLKL